MANFYRVQTSCLEGFILILMLIQMVVVSGVLSYILLHGGVHLMVQQHYLAFLGKGYSLAG